MQCGIRGSNRTTTHFAGEGFQGARKGGRYRKFSRSTRQPQRGLLEKMRFGRGSQNSIFRLGLTTSYLIYRGVPDAPRLKPAIKAGFRSFTDATRAFMNQLLAVAADFLVEPLDFGLKFLWIIGYQNILNLDECFLEAIANFKAPVGVGFIFAVVDLAQFA